VTSHGVDLAVAKEDLAAAKEEEGAARRGPGPRACGLDGSHRNLCETRPQMTFNRRLPTRHVDTNGREVTVRQRIEGWSSKYGSSVIASNTKSVLQ